MINCEVPCNYFNLAPMGMDRCYIIDYTRLLGSNCTDTSFCNTYRKFFVTALQNAHLSFIFISSSKDLTFSLIVGPVMGFPLEFISVNHLYNTLPSCANLGSFSMCVCVCVCVFCLKRSSSLSFGTCSGTVGHTALQAGRLCV